MLGILKGYDLLTIFWSSSIGKSEGLIRNAQIICPFAIASVANLIKSCQNGLTWLYGHDNYLKRKNNLAISVYPLIG